MQLQGTVYIDSVFFLNLVMNFYLLLLTGKVSGQTSTYRRILAGSAVGAALYCLLLCIPGSYACKVLFGMIPTGMLAVKIACGTKGLRGTAHATGYLFVFSCLLGGFILFLKAQFPGIFQRTVSTMLIPATGFLGFLLCRFVVNGIRRRKQEYFCYVNLEGNTGIHRVRALIDTGNGLREPVSGQPVAILDEEEWGDLKGYRKPEKYKIIPYHSIGCDHGLLEGYEVENVEIVGKEQSRRLQKVIIAVFKGRVSGKGTYQMIVPSEFIG